MKKATVMLNKNESRAFFESAPIVADIDGKMKVVRPTFDAARETMKPYVPALVKTAGNIAKSYDKKSGVTVSNRAIIALLQNIAAAYGLDDVKILSCDANYFRARAIRADNKGNIVVASNATLYNAVYIVLMIRARGGDYAVTEKCKMPMSKKANKKSAKK